MHLHPVSIMLLSPLAVQTALAAPHKPTPKPSWTSAPTHYAVVVFPGVQALDVHGPLDVLWGLGPIGINASIHLSVLARSLHPVSTVVRPTAGHNMSHGEFGTAMVPSATFDEVLGQYAGGGRLGDGHGDSHGDEKERMDDDKGPIDVLIVPGGGGTRGDVSAEIAFVREMYPRVRYLLTVCTGATILARTHHLDNRAATANKKAWAWATSTGPDVRWVPQARWVVDGNIWTSSGVSAGIDMMLAFVDHLYGEETGDFVAAALEYERWEGGKDRDPFAAVWDVPGVED